tara:strand:+ start:243 stop:410 length:168 start_codon:yes stop_codon:yes gene_type:complete
MYAVKFDGKEVWGASAEPNSSVVLDAWEAYLEIEESKIENRRSRIEDRESGVGDE